MISANIEENLTTLLNEKQISKYADDTCPREIITCQIEKLLTELRQENAEFQLGLSEYMVIFNISDENTSKIIRAIQEDQLLKTKLKLKQKNRVITLKSFWEVWNVNGAFRNEIINSSDPNEEKWKLCRKYGYKLATTFMPSYAKAVYEYFGSPKIVLDPCSGWGDRLLGAEVAGVQQYIGFDPNSNLRPGYSDIMTLCGHQPCELSPDYIGFSNSYKIYSSPFEVGSPSLEDNSVDFIFTSPPFFDYEIYSDANPRYRDWIKGFYEPLFKQCSRIVKPNCYVCIYISDTSAGEIDKFIQEDVSKFTRLVLQERHIGFCGLWSGVIRKIWVFKKSG
jgi:uncharacterized FlaG/YvyC family protein